MPGELDNTLSLPAKRKVTPNILNGPECNRDDVFDTATMVPHEALSYPKHADKELVARKGSLDCSRAYALGKHKAPAVRCLLSQ